MHRGQRVQAKARGDLLIRRRVAVPGRKAGEKVDNLFLPPRDSHAAILANKKRIGSEILEESSSLTPCPKMEHRQLVPNRETQSLDPHRYSLYRAARRWMVIGHRR